MKEDLGRARSVSLNGLEGRLIEIEALAVRNLPAFVLIGLPDTAVGESRDRIRAAFAATGLRWPDRRITVNLLPADLPKSGSAFDLGIAVALLGAIGMIKPAVAQEVVHLGELGLDGRLHPVRGILPAVMAAAAEGAATVVVPEANASEAQLVPGIRVRAASCLAQVAADYGCQISVPDLAPVRLKEAPVSPASPGDLADVVGQQEGRLALELAAAGGHHLMMVGPPGTGKTMLASRMPSILPDLTGAESLQVTAIHSLCGTLPGDAKLVRSPPFESPHHTATPAAIVGGGSGLPRPGAISRAHCGVLHLDEAPEFSARVLQTLRQPLEDGYVSVQRARATARYPARFQLVLSANPCPCGKWSGRGRDCSCSVLSRRRYFNRLSGPLMDRIDIQIWLSDVRTVREDSLGESSATVSGRVSEARERQRARFEGCGWSVNARAPGRWLRQQAWDSRTRTMKDLEQALSRGMLSMRGVDRVLRLAWTVADLAKRDVPNRDDAALALAMRTRLGGQDASL